MFWIRIQGLGKCSYFETTKNNEYTKEIYNRISFTRAKNKQGAGNP